jgi:hypothetical protein
MRRLMARHAAVSVMNRFFQVFDLVRMTLRADRITTQRLQRLRLMRKFRDIRVAVVASNPVVLGLMDAHIRMTIFAVELVCREHGHREQHEGTEDESAKFHFMHSF